MAFVFDHRSVDASYSSGGGAAHQEARFDPAVQQAGVNIQCERIPTSYDDALRYPDELNRYPAGQRVDHSLQKGELAFYSPSDQMRHGAGMPGSPQFRVRSALNGIHKYSDLAFLGVVAKPSDDQDANLVSLQVAGSVTIFNAGPHTIRGGELVVWDYPPTNDRHGMRMAIYRNSPADSFTRFVPILRPFSAQDVLTNWLGAMDMCAGSASEDEVVERFGLLRTPNKGTDMDPVRRLHRLLNGKSFDVPTNFDIPWSASATAMFREFSTSTVSGTPLPVFKPSGSLGTTEHRMAIAILQADYMQLARSRVIGKALSHALPNTSLDILIGALH